MKRTSIGVIVVMALLFFFARPSLAGKSGIWWDPAFSGQGVTIHKQGPLIFGGWYLYDDIGLSAWLTFEGTLSDGTLSTSFTSFTGPPFGGTWDPSLVVPTTTGSLTLTFNSPSSATFAYSLDGTTGTLNLVRFGDTTQHLNGFYFGSLTPSSPTAGIYTCESSNMHGSINSGEIRGFLVSSSGGVMQMSGDVSSDGTISNGVAREYSTQTQVGTFIGTVDGVTAGGTWSDVLGCAGTWSATHQ